MKDKKTTLTKTEQKEIKKARNRKNDKLNNRELIKK